MANYYRQFSVVITDITPEESEWISSQLDDELWDEEALPDWATEDDESLRFEWELDEDLRIYATSEDDGAGDTDQVAGFLSAFLRRFRPDDFIVLNYAQLCSSPGPGDIGGGSYVIGGGGEVERMYGDNWAWGRIEELKRGRSSLLTSR